MNKWTRNPSELQDIDRCLVAQRIRGGNGGINVTILSIDANSLSTDIVGIMDLPEHCYKNLSGWNFPYNGGEEPSKSGWYLVCFERFSPYFPNVEMRYFDADRLTWLALSEKYGEVIAWRRVPRWKEAT